MDVMDYKQSYLSMMWCRDAVVKENEQLKARITVLEQQVAVCREVLPKILQKLAEYKFTGSPSLSHQRIEEAQQITRQALSMIEQEKI